MSESKQPQKTDFFQEALKAFDAPAREEVPQPAATAELGPVPETLEDNIRPPKPVFWRKWWPAILSLAACIALLAAWLWPAGISERGENWLYGSVADVMDTGFVLVEENGERWYVEYDELNEPEALVQNLAGMNYCWVFYNGEPKEFDQHGCSKMVFAAAVHKPGYTSEGLTGYGYIYDSIQYDLDSDGEKEKILLCSGRTSGVFTYRIVSLNVAGEIELDASFGPTGAGTGAFHIHDGELHLVHALETAYLVYDISVASGELLVSHKGQQIEAGDPAQETVMDPEEDPMFLWSVISSGGFQATTIAKEKADDLYRRLNALAWSPGVPDDIGCFLNFRLILEGVDHQFCFYYDGSLSYNGMTAAVDKNLLMELLSLIRSKAPQYAQYRRQTANGQELCLNMYEDGTFDLWEMATGEFQVVIPTSGNYIYTAGYYSLFSVDEQTHIYTFRDDGDALVYIEGMSYLPQWDMVSGQIFKADVPKAYEVMFGLYTSNNILNGGSALVTSDFCTLSESEANSLISMLNRLEWAEYEGSDPEYAGFFTLSAGENSATYYFTDDAQLYCGGKKVRMSASLWTLVMELLQHVGSTFDTVSGEYLGQNYAGDALTLSLSDKGIATLHYGAGTGMAAVFMGNYAVVEDHLFLFSTNSLPVSSSLDFNTEVMLFQIQENGMRFIKDKTSQGIQGILDGQVFSLQLSVEADSLVSVSFQFVPLTPPGGVPLTAQTEEYVLDRGEKAKLGKLLSGLEWLDGGYNASLAVMSVTCDGGSVRDYRIASGRLLISDAGTAKLSEDEWNYLMQILVSLGDFQGSARTFTAECDNAQYTLVLDAANGFLLTQESAGGQISVNGTYVQVGQILFFFAQGDAFLMQQANADQLEYQYAGSGLAYWGIPDELIFSRAYSFTAMRFEGCRQGSDGAEDPYTFAPYVLTQEQIGRVSSMIRSLKWVDGNSAADPICIGTVQFYGEDQFSYSLWSGNMLRSGDRWAELSPEHWELLMDLLTGVSDPAEGDRCYIASWEEKQLQLELTAAHSFTLSAVFGLENGLVSGVYFRAGDTFVCVGSDGQVMTLTKQTDGTLHYQPAASRIIAWSMPEMLCFAEPEIIPEDNPQQH